MDRKRNTGRVGVEERLFRVIISQFQAEESVPGWLHQIIILSNFLVYFLATCSPLLDLFFPGLQFSRYSWEVLIFCSVYLCLQLSLYMFSAIFYSNTLGFSQQPPLSIRVTCLSGLLFKKAIYPLLVWSFMTLVMVESSALVWGLAVPSLLFGTTMALVFLVLMFNKMPSRALIAVLENSQDYIIYFVLKAAIILSVVGTYQKSRSASIALNLTSTTLICLQLGYSIYHHKFWNPKANLWLIQLSFFLLVSNLWTQVVVLFPKYFIMSGFLITMSLSFKFAENIVSSAIQVDFFSTAYSPHRRVMGIVSLERLLTRYRRRELEGLEVSQFNFYRGILGDHLMAKPGEPTLESLVNSGEKLIAYLTSFVEGQGKEEAMLYLLPKLILISVIPHLPLWRPTMQRLREKIGGSIRGRLELFHLELLFEARMEAIYLQKKQEVGTEFSLRHLYTTIGQLSAQNAGNNVVDLALPFLHKALFTELFGRLKKLVSSETNVFVYLAAEGGTNALSANHLFDLSKTAREDMLSFDEFVDSQIAPIKLPPSYFFPPLYLYQALIRHNSSKAMKILHVYRKNVGLWELLKNRGQTLRLDAVDANAAVLEIAMEGNRSGKIISATSQSEEYLGTPPDGAFEGHDIHEFFISQIRKNHIRMMQEYNKLEGVLGATREFFLQTFDNELKEIIFCMKIVVRVDGGFHGVAAVKPIHKVKCHLVVLGEGLEVLHAEKSFWQTLVPLSTPTKKKTKVSHVGEFTNKLPPAIELYKIAINFDNKVKNEGLVLEEGSIFYQLSRCLSTFLRLNDQEKIVFSAESRSKFYSQLKTTPMTVRVKLLTFDRMHLTSLFITFGSTELNNAIMNREQSKSFVGFDIRSQYSSAENVPRVKKLSEEMTSLMGITKSASPGSKPLGSSSRYIRVTRPEQDDLDLDTEACIRIEFVFAELKHILRLVDKDLYPLLPQSLKEVVDQIKATHSKFEEVFTHRGRISEKVIRIGSGNTHAEEEATLKVAYDPLDPKLIHVRSNVTAESPLHTGLSKHTRTLPFDPDNEDVIPILGPSLSLLKETFGRLPDPPILESSPTDPQKKFSLITPGLTSNKLISMDHPVPSIPKQNNTEVRLISVQPLAEDEEEGAGHHVKRSSMPKLSAAVNSSVKLLHLLKPVHEEGQEVQPDSPEKTDQENGDGSEDEEPQIKTDIHQVKKTSSLEHSHKQPSKENFSDRGGGLVVRRGAKRTTIITAKGESFQNQSRHDVRNMDEESVGVELNNEFFWIVGANSSVASVRESKSNQEEKRIHHAMSTDGHTSLESWLVAVLLGYPLIFLVFFMSSWNLFAGYAREVTELWTTDHKLSVAVQTTVSTSMLALDQTSVESWRQAKALEHKAVRDFDFHYWSTAPGGDVLSRKKLEEIFPGGIAIDGISMRLTWIGAFRLAQDILTAEGDVLPDEEDLEELQTIFLPRVFVPLLDLTEPQRREAVIEVNHNRTQALLGLSLALGFALLTLLGAVCGFALKSQKALAEILAGYSMATRQNLALEQESLKGINYFLSLNLFHHKQAFVDAADIIKTIKLEEMWKGDSLVNVILENKLGRAGAVSAHNNAEGHEGSRPTLSKQNLSSLHHLQMKLNDKDYTRGKKNMKPKRSFLSLDIRVKSVFPSIRKFFILSGTQTVLLFLSLVFIILQCKMDQKISDYISFAETHSYALNNFHKILALVYMLNPLAAPSVAGVLENYTELKDPRSLERAVGLYSSLLEANRDVIASMQSSALSKLLSEDCCALEYPLPFPGGETSCRQLVVGSPSQGCLPYLSVAAKTMDSFLRELQSQPQPDLKEWWSRTLFTNVRLTHPRIVAAMSHAVSKEVEIQVNIVGQLRFQLTGTLRLMGIVCLVVVVFAAPFLLIATRSDHKVARHLFAMLTPRTILQNAHLMARFKRTFTYLPHH